MSCFLVYEKDARHFFGHKRTQRRVAVLCSGAAREAANTETASSNAGLTARSTGTRSPVSPRCPIRQRKPFDIFEDQYRNLKQIAEDERSHGLPGSMSHMVREAIDHYVTQRRK